MHICSAQVGSTSSSLSVSQYCSAFPPINSDDGKKIKMHPLRWLAHSRCLITFIHLCSSDGRASQGKWSESLCTCAVLRVIWGEMDISGYQDGLVGDQHHSEGRALQRNHSRMLRTEPQGWWKGQKPSVKSWEVKGHSILEAGRWSVREGRVSLLLLEALNLSLSHYIHFPVGRQWARLSFFPSFIFPCIHHPVSLRTSTQILKCISVISSSLFKNNEILYLKPGKISSFQHCTSKILIGPRCLIINHIVENGRKKTTHALNAKWVIWGMCHLMSSQNSPER